MKTILFMGQSNAIGRGDGGLLTFGPLVTVWNNQNDLTNTTALGTAFVAPNLTANPFVNSKNNMGVHMANKLAAILKEDVRLILVAKGGESIDMWTNASGTKGAMYTRMAAVLAAASVTSVDILAWHQGETDDTSAGTYEARFDLMIGHLTTDGYIDADTPIIVGTTASKFTNINPVLTAIGNRGGRFGLAPLSDLPTYDTTHFGGSDLVVAGRRYVDALSRTEGVYEGISPYGLGGYGFLVRSPDDQIKLANTQALINAVMGEKLPLKLDIFGTTTPGVGTYSTQSGWYRRMGSMILFQSDTVITAHTGTGDMQLKGLPYSSNSGGTGNFGDNPVSVVSIMLTGITFPADRSIMAFVSGTTIVPLAMGSNLSGAASGIPMDTSSARITISGMYETAEPL